MHMKMHISQKESSKRKKYNMWQPFIHSFIHCFLLLFKDSKRFTESFQLLLPLYQPPCELLDCFYSATISRQSAVHLWTSNKINQPTSKQTHTHTQKKNNPLRQCWKPRQLRHEHPVREHCWPATNECGKWIS